MSGDIPNSTRVIFLNFEYSCSVTTPSSLIKNCEKSLYNNQYYLSLEKPKMFSKDNKIFYEMIDKLNKKIFLTIQNAVSVHNVKDGKTLIFENFTNPYSIENNKNLKFYIENMNQTLFYDSNFDVIPRDIKLSENFMKELINKKIKCIFKPMIWVKTNNNKVLAGIKYFISQCMISNIKYIDEDKIINKKILSFDNENFDCAICHNSMKNNNGNNYNTAVTELSCKHKFHFKCINTWWSTQSNSNINLSCPICRNL